MERLEGEGWDRPWTDGSRAVLCVRDRQSMPCPAAGIGVVMRAFGVEAGQVESSRRPGPTQPTDGPRRHGAARNLPGRPANQLNYLDATLRPSMSLCTTPGVTPQAQDQDLKARHYRIMSMTVGCAKGPSTSDGRHAPASLPPVHAPSISVISSSQHSTTARRLCMQDASLAAVAVFRLAAPPTPLCNWHASPVLDAKLGIRAVQCSAVGKKHHHHHHHHHHDGGPSQGIQHPRHEADVSDLTCRFASCPPPRPPSTAEVFFSSSLSASRTISSTDQRH
ncbi:hypothetical protein IWX50DRAFT_616012 [Phyllosticta citricarpa]|uniref:Uncharacterized protein n=1 Tax=Phyllosticta citricarpa TaxID=55181 RepID=A0ABR1MEE5_9PEZI